MDNRKRFNAGVPAFEAMEGRTLMDGLPFHFTPNPTPTLPTPGHDSAGEIADANWFDASIDTSKLPATPPDADPWQGFDFASDGGRDGLSDPFAGNPGDFGGDFSGNPDQVTPPDSPYHPISIPDLSQGNGYWAGSDAVNLDGSPVINWVGDGAAPGGAFDPKSLVSGVYMPGHKPVDVGALPEYQSLNEPVVVDYNPDTGSAQPGTEDLSHAVLTFDVSKPDQKPGDAVFFAIDQSSGSVDGAAAVTINFLV